MGKTVTHLIIGLGKGGAETMLYQVLKYRSTPDLSYRVISLGTSHFYEEPIRKLGYEVIELDIRKRPIWTFLKLCGLLRGTEVLCCWMYHANFIGYVASRLSGVKRVIWCIRHSNLDPALNSRVTLLINRICAKWSRHIDVIAYNGEKTKKVHEMIGYVPEKGCILDNGCDFEEYKPDGAAKRQLRKELGLAEESRIVLSVTKFTPIKDVPTFLAALSNLRKKNPDIVGVLCGLGIEYANLQLTALCKEAGLTMKQDVFLLGLRHDVPKLMAACDVFVLHSAGEAFPNALLQAMACGCLCLTTDVGDARRILNRQEYVVPAGDAVSVCTGMEELLNLSAADVARMRAENRQSLQQRFDIRKIVRQYEALYEVQ